MVLGIVVEGRSDKEFCQKLFRPWLIQQGYRSIRVVVPGDRSRLIRDAQKHYDTLSLQGCIRVLFLLDQDHDECPPITANLINVREDNILVCVAARALEAWLLADSDAVNSATGHPPPRGRTDTIQNPKRDLQALFYRSNYKYPTEMQMIKSISPRYSLERAAERNRSLQRLLERIREGR